MADPRSSHPTRLCRRPGRGGGRWNILFARSQRSNDHVAKEARCISRRKTKGRNAKLRKFQTPSILPNREFGRRTSSTSCPDGRMRQARIIKFQLLSITGRTALRGCAARARLCVRRCGPLKRPRPPAPVRRRPAAVPASGLRHGGARAGGSVFFSRNLAV